MNELTQSDNYQLLNRELAAPDPWGLDANPFERERHTQMLRLALAQGSISSALEVGCAAGAFTVQLAPHCKRLTVIDVVPQAIERSRRRIRGSPHISWIVSDVQQFSPDERFDLIVVAEVLYYIGGIAEMRGAVRNFSADACARWISGFSDRRATPTVVAGATLLVLRRSSAC